MFEDKDTQLTSLSDLGEFGLIQTLTKQFDISQPSTQLGVGDDAAVLQFDTQNQVVISTDMLVEGIHFDLGFMPMKHLGYKAVMVNLSDICAMNATPSQITVSIACSNRFSLEALQELYEGIHIACKAHNIDLIGGDTTSSLSGLVISVTAVGHLPKEQTPVTRKGAKPTDLICVTGDLGAAYAGLQILLREQAIFKENPEAPNPDLSAYAYAIGKQLRPDARVDVVAKLKELGITPTSMIDISDGLSSELEHIHQQSKVGYKIFEHKLPIDPVTMSISNELNTNATVMALNGGEDYQLLFTIPLAQHELIKDLEQVSVIGHIVEEVETKVMITSQETEIKIKQDGWQVFKKDE